MTNHPLTTAIAARGVHVFEDECAPLTNGRTRIEWAVFDAAPVVVAGCITARPDAGAAVEADATTRIAHPIGTMPAAVRAAITDAGWHVAPAVRRPAPYA